MIFGLDFANAGSDPERYHDLPAVEPSPATADLLATLKALRRTIAADLKKPAYIVFSDATLLDMAVKQPTTIYEFRLVNGVGDHKASQFGAQFLEAIAAWRAAL